MGLINSEVYQWFRVAMCSFLAMLTFYNAAHFKGLMKLWFLMLGLMFVVLSVIVLLHTIDSPYYDKFSNGIFFPIIVALVTIEIAFIINRHLSLPFNHRKDDL